MKHKFVAEIHTGQTVVYLQLVAVHLMDAVGQVWQLSLKKFDAQAVDKVIVRADE
jgi:hypothetical protein